MRIRSEVEECHQRSEKRPRPLAFRATFVPRGMIQTRLRLVCLSRLTDSRVSTSSLHQTWCSPTWTLSNFSTIEDVGEIKVQHLFGSESQILLKVSQSSKSSTTTCYSLQLLRNRTDSTSNWMSPVAASTRSHARSSWLKAQRNPQSNGTDIHPP